MKAIKSGRQRRDEIKAAREKRAARQRLALAAERPAWRPAGRIVAVAPELLRPNNSYGEPDFVRRGYYEDMAFRCVDCGAECVWTADRQRWWYEVAKGDVFSTARRCAACRARERERRDEARRIHFAGLRAKAARLRHKIEQMTKE